MTEENGVEKEECPVCEDVKKLDGKAYGEEMCSDCADKLSTYNRVERRQKEQQKRYQERRAREREFEQTVL